MSTAQQPNYFDFPERYTAESLFQRPVGSLRVNLEQTIVALLEQQRSAHTHYRGVKQQPVSDQVSTNDELSLSGTGRLRSNSSEGESETNQNTSKGTSTSESEPVHESAEGESQGSQQGSQRDDVKTVSAEVELARKVAELGGGLSGCTTVMIKHIPLKYTQRQLMQEINKNGFAERYDFLYMPADARNHGNRGFAFVNFLDADIAMEFYHKHHGRKLQKHNMEKTMVILPADLQGFEKNVEQYVVSRKNRKQVAHAEPAYFRQMPRTPNTQLQVPVAQTGQARGRNNGAKSNVSANVQKKQAPQVYEAPWPNASEMPFGMPKVPPVVRFCAFCGIPRSVGHAFCPYCGGQYHN